MKTKINFPMYCNQKSVILKNKKGKIYQGSYIIIPKNTIVTIFENCNKDPSSDCDMINVLLKEDTMAIVYQSAKIDKNAINVELG